MMTPSCFGQDRTSTCSIQSPLNRHYQRLKQLQRVTTEKLERVAAIINPTGAAPRLTRTSHDDTRIHLVSTEGYAACTLGQNVGQPQR